MKNKNENTIDYDTGRWSSRKDGCAVYRNVIARQEDVYNRESLDFAISNIKMNRKTYTSEEAYLSHLRHFEKGLCYLS